MGDHSEVRARFFHEASEAALVQDTQRRFVDVNRAACDLLGLPREQLLGKRLEDFSPPAADAPGPARETVEQAWEAFLAHGEAHGQMPLFRPDGTRVLVEYRATAHVAPGLHLSLLRDVSGFVVATARSDRLQQMAARLVEDPSPSAVFELVIRRGLRDLGVRSGCLGLLDRTGETIVDARCVGPEDEAGPRSAPFGSMALDAALPVAEATREKRAIFLSTPNEVRARWPKVAEQKATGACAALPLVVRGETIGAMAVTYDDPRAFDAGERAFMQGAAQICAAAVDRAAAHRALQDSEQAQRFLADAGVAFAQSLDEKETLKATATLATRAFADWCLVDLYEAGRTRLTRAAVGHSDPRLAPLAEAACLAPRFEVPRPEYAPTRALQLGEPVLVRDFDESKYAAAATSEEHAALVRAIHPRSLVAVPLRARRGAGPRDPHPLRSSPPVRRARNAHRDRVRPPERHGHRERALVRGRAPGPSRRRRGLAREGSVPRGAGARAAKPARSDRDRPALHGHPRQPGLREGALDHRASGRPPGPPRRRSARRLAHHARQDRAAPSVRRDRRRHRQGRGDRGPRPRAAAPPAGDRAAHRIRARLRRRGAAHAGVRQPPHERRQVHAAGGDDPRARRGRSRAGPGRRGRLGHRHRARALAPRLRDLRSGRARGERAGRAGPGPRDRQEPDGAPRRKGDRAERRPRAGERVRRGAAPAPRGGGGRRPAGERGRARRPHPERPCAHRGRQRGRRRDARRGARDDGPRSERGHRRPERARNRGEDPAGVALLDIGLPVMDGYEVARRLRQIPGCERTRLVALTGYGQESDRERSRQAGFAQHLVKPVDLDEVTRAVAA